MSLARLVALLDLRDCPAERRRLVIMLPDYPGADGRTGYAVGLDAPASVLACSLSRPATAGGSTVSSFGR